MTRSSTPPRRPLAWLVLLVLLACALGGKAPPGPPEQQSDGPPLLPTSTTISCPAPDPAASPFPAELPQAATSPAGTIPGSFAVSQSGEATYSISLTVPPGRAGMEPSLAVSYGSSGGDGFLGVGFSLAGLSSIARCPANLADDGHIRPVRYDAADHFCLSGARLVQVAEQLALDGSLTREYRMIPDSFAKIVGHYASLSKLARGPERFEVFTKAGRILEYGGKDDGRVMAKKGVIAAWWLTEEKDRHGNAVTYQYDNVADTNDGHTLEIVPFRIGYAHRPDHTPSRVVALTHTASPSPSTSYTGGMKLQRTKVLSKIEMMTDAVVRTYHLDYMTGEGTGRALLRTVRECAGANGPCKPETSFAWSSHAGKGFTPKKTGIIQVQDGFDVGFENWVLADVNGDGLDDLVVWHPKAGDGSIDEWWVSLNTGGDFGPSKLWASFPHPDADPPAAGRWHATPIDVDQDGLTDIFLDADNVDWATYKWLHAHPDHTFDLRDTGIPRPAEIHPMFAWQLPPYRFMRLGDVNGDGVADLIECKNLPYGPTTGDSIDPANNVEANRRWTVHLWSPSLPGGPGFESKATTIPLVDKTVDCGWGQRSVYVADLDGDGVAELVVPFTGNTYGAIRNVGGDDWTSRALHLFRDDSLGFVSLHFLDTNGDGLSDVIMTGLGQGWCDYGGESGGVSEKYCNPPQIVGEMSQDLPFLFTNRGGLGETFSDLTPTLPGPPVPGLWTDWFGDVATPIDYNGDGRMDLLMPITGRCTPSAAHGDACWVVLQSSHTGEGFTTLVDTNIPVYVEGFFSEAIEWFNVKVTDVDGDGRHDLVAPDFDDDGTFTIYRNDGPQDLLVSVTDGTRALDPGDPGFVPTVAIHYGNLVDLAVTKGIAATSPEHDDLLYVARSDPNNGCAYPRACVAGPERVVRSYVLDNGHAERRSFELKYRDGRFHHKGRGFLGFGERMLVDGDTAAGSVEIYDNVTHDGTFDTFPFAGQVVRSLAWSNTKPSWSDPGQVEMTFGERSLELYATNAGETYFTLPVMVRTTRQEGTMQPGPGRSVLRFVEAAASSPLAVLGESWDSVVVHDDYGNVLEEGHQVSGADLTTSVTRTYNNDPSTWLVGLLRSEETCSTGFGTTQCRSTTLDHDGHGDVWSASVGDPADAGTQLLLSFGYDAFGHAVYVWAEDRYGHQREACTSYDADGMFPYAVADGLGHVAYARFDAGLGVMTAAVDPNGLAVRWRHDGFGRMTEELRPDGTTTTVGVARTKDGGPQASWWQTKVTTKEEGGAIRTTALDGLGRPVHSWTLAAQVEARGASTSSPVLQLEAETTYDFLGRVTRTTLPWMSGDSLTGKLHDDYAYDAGGRLTKHTEPWGRVTTFARHGLVTSATDWLGTTTSTVDALGRPVMVQDRQGHPTQTWYGPFGDVSLVMRFGNEVTVSERDAYGRVLHEIDPDRGETDTTYDGFGEVLTIDDQAARHYGFSYDALGRLIERDDADGATTWAYDTAAHGIGKLAAVTTAESVKQYTYNALSQPSSVSLGLGGETFTASFGYDGKGRVHEIVYPQQPGVDPLIVLRDYDVYGNLVRVRDNAGGKPYWQLTQVDGAGRPTGEIFGDGVTSARSYDPASGLVQSIQTSHGASTLQDLAYGYDQGLRMRYRADNLQVGTAGVRHELFGHDAIDRLVCARFVDLPAKQPVPGHVPGSCALSVSYHDNGNIAEKSDVGTYGYDPAHPHAVQTAGAGAYAYDPVGNQTVRPGVSSISYTAFDLPSVVTLDIGEPVSILYDGDQQRILKRADEGETLYFEDLYERMTPNGGTPVHRCYVAAGSATLVLSRQAGGGNAAAYLHTEALGSTDVVTYGGGKAPDRQSYDAFGARRSPVWKPNAPPVALGSDVSPVGYTGHESDDDLGLVNMRGRIYDPTLGRFLQVDPIVSHPHYGQSWNPYSYVMNSPLNFTDPSGFQDAGPPGGAPAGCDATCRFSSPDGTWLKLKKGPEQTADGGRTKGHTDAWIPVKDSGRDDARSVQQQIDVETRLPAPRALTPQEMDAVMYHGNPAWKFNPLIVAIREFSRGMAFALVPLGPQADDIATDAGHLPRGTNEEQAARAVGQLAGAAALGELSSTGPSGGGEPVVGASGGAAAAAVPMSPMLVLAVAGAWNAVSAFASVATGGGGSGGTRVTGAKLEARRAEFNRMRPQLWKEEAKMNPGDYSAENLELMRKGDAPVGSDGKPMEIHHITPLSEGGANEPGNFRIMTRTEHRLGKNFRANHPGVRRNP